MSVQMRTRVIIIGAGFGGIFAAKQFENQSSVDVLLIDRHNFHTFTPLLYQVATCGLEAEEIAYPVRGIFRGRSNIHFLLGEVIEIDRANKRIGIETPSGNRTEFYDYLIVAAGSVTNYFNSPEISEHAFELKNVSDALILRNHILSLVERAVWESDPEKRRALTTIVVVGGGPTGLETAGAMYELYTHVLLKEFPFLSELGTCVTLVEATEKLLLAFPEELQSAALDQLRNLGVNVILGNPVSETGDDYVRLKDGTMIQAHTLVWAAGVKANPLADALGLETKRSGRISVQPTLRSQEDDAVFIVGDMAYLENEHGHPYPMLIPVAKQQGILAAKNILRTINGKPLGTFRYIDRGIMATIGRSRAVAWIYNRIPLRGYLAWVSWLGLHLIALMGFRNRVNVLVNWIWNYLTYDRSMRIILADIPSENTSENHR